MELKVQCINQQPSVAVSFNRTFMELKVMCLFCLLLLLSRFNRTFMELKAPLPRLPAAASGFQSHLYGIERWSWRGVGGRTAAFQSHLYGIESSSHTAVGCRAPRFNRTFMELKV